MNLLFCINHSYINQFIICVQSIVRFKDEYHIYVFHTDLTHEDKNKIEKKFLSSALFEFIEIDKTLIKDFPTTDRYPLEIYYRILAANYLPKNIDKILYLDADIVVINPLNKLYETDLDEYYYGACTHVRSFLRYINNRRLGSKKNYPYINTGVLLMNLRNLRCHQTQTEVLLFVKKYHKKLLLPDQDIISILYGDKIKILDYMKYNLSDRMLNVYNINIFHKKKTLQWIKQECSIIHYCGRNKPWNKKYYGKLDQFYLDLLENRGDINVYK